MHVVVEQVHTPHWLLHQSFECRSAVVEGAPEAGGSELARTLSHQLRETEVDEDALLTGGTEADVGRLDVAVDQSHPVQLHQLLPQLLLVLGAPLFGLAALLHGELDAVVVDHQVEAYCLPHYWSCLQVVSDEQHEVLVEGPAELLLKVVVLLLLVDHP